MKLITIKLCIFLVATTEVVFKTLKKISSSNLCIHLNVTSNEKMCKLSSFLCVLFCFCLFFCLNELCSSVFSHFSLNLDHRVDIPSNNNYLFNWLG